MSFAAHSFEGRLPDRSDARELLERIAASQAPQRMAASRAPVVLYGAGELGQMARAWCEAQQVDVLGVVDARAEHWQGHPSWSGVPLWRPDDVPPALRSQARLLLCISTLPVSALLATLQSQGWLQLQPFYDFVDAWPQRQSLNNGWRAQPPMAQGLQQAHTVLSTWCDDVSRAHHLQFMAWRCLHQEWRFEQAPVHTAQRYAIAEFVAAWQDGERLLDAGAHHGQILQRFLAERPDGLAQAWAVEPDSANRAVLQSWANALPPSLRERIELHDFALARRSGHRRFVAGQGYASRIWGAGDEMVAVRAIDDLAWQPSFIKLHLEGGEWRALQGAVRTLTSCRPLLALTVYHRRDGLYPLAHWLMRLLPDHQWRFRLHGWLGTAAVIYGVPPGR